MSSVIVSTLSGVVGKSGLVDGKIKQATFSDLKGICCDNNGIIYSSDGGAIRKINVVEETVSTLCSVAGRPSGIVCDNHGNLFVCCFNDHTIKKIDCNNGNVSIFCGKEGKNGGTDGKVDQATFKQPHSICTDGNCLFVSESGNHPIRKINFMDGSVSTLCGIMGQQGYFDGSKNEAKFCYPSGICIDKNGFLYVCDFINHVIRKIDTKDGGVSTVCGKSGEKGHKDGIKTETSFNFPVGICCNTNGDTLFVTDQYNHTIRKIDITTGKVETLCGIAEMKGSIDGNGTVATFNDPTGICFDLQGNLLVADNRNNLIRKVELKEILKEQISNKNEMINKQKEISQLQNDSNKITEKLQQEIKQLKNQHKEEIIQLNNELKNKTDQETELKAVKSELENTKKQLKNNKDQAETELRSSKDQLEKANSTIAKLEKDRKVELNNTKEQLKNKTDQAETQLRAVKDELEKANSTIAKLEKDPKMTTATSQNSSQSNNLTQTIALGRCPNNIPTAKGKQVSGIILFWTSDVAAINVAW